jgi:hypothetical protein
MRPKLCRSTNADEFMQHYWLKEELVEFCKDNKILHSGGKTELAQRIAYFLKGETVENEKRAVGGRGNKAIPKRSGPLDLDSIIPSDYRNDEEHREFFLKVIGSKFKFNVTFMDWMKANSGKTYQDAVDQWKKIAQAKRNGEETEIAPQFEYNQYTRSFFQENPELTRADMIRCWNHKKAQPGSHRYEDSDLEILQD